MNDQEIMYFIAAANRRRPLLANQKEALILSTLYYSRGILYKKGITLFSGYTDLSPQFRELKKRGYIKEYPSGQMCSITDKGTEKVNQWLQNMKILKNEKYLLKVDD